MVDAPDTVAEFVRIPELYNTYTMFGDVYFDFGLPGVIVMFFFFGFAVERMHRRARAKNSLAASWIAAVLIAIMFGGTVTFRLFWLDTALWLVAGTFLMQRLGARRDSRGDPGLVRAWNGTARPAPVLALNIGVLGLFSLESVTMAELFGSRTRFTQLALSKEIGGILATAIGPVVAATLTAVTGSWWPIAAMLVAYSLITLVATLLSPETRGRDLVRLEDAV
jgi:hypothetical protein